MTIAYDASDPVAESNAGKEAARRAKNDADCLRFILSTRARRDWFYRLLDKCHIYGSTFSNEETHRTAFQLGEENIGKQLMLAAIDASADLYMTMVKEQREDEKRLAVVREREAQKRESADDLAAVDQQFVPDLPPPKGYPGHKPPDPIP